MTRIIKLAADVRLRVEKKAGMLECHLEQINKNGHWNGRAWFFMTQSVIEELMEAMKE